ncbi:hypothetical protein [Francisella salina]|uniref:Uncharacterized protein n=1 Tax=Francisella salina TaxID=573569 RepID=A0ABN3ZVQ5_FRAST|nr:hypothetical protein [Francisella salina]AEI36829.1 hypothetical protein F7308_1905 [Francisella salina]
MKKVMIISLGDKGKSHLSWDAGHEASLCASFNDDVIELYKLQLNKDTYFSLTYSSVTVNKKDTLQDSYNAFKSTKSFNLGWKKICTAYMDSSKYNEFNDLIIKRKFIEILNLFKKIINKSALETIDESVYVFLSPTNTTPPLSVLEQNNPCRKPLKQECFNIFALAFYLSILEYCADRKFVIGTCAGLHALAYFHSIDIYGLKDEATKKNIFKPISGFNFTDGSKNNYNDPMFGQHQLAYNHSSVPAIKVNLKKEASEVNDIFSDDLSELSEGEQHSTFNNKYFVTEQFPSITFREHIGMRLSDSYFSFDKQLIPIGEMHGSWFSGYQDHPHHNFNLSKQMPDLLDERFGLHENKLLYQNNKLISKKIRKKFYERTRTTRNEESLLNQSSFNYDTVDVVTKKLPNLYYCRKIEFDKSKGRYVRKGLDSKYRDSLYRSMYRNRKLKLKPSDK